MIAEIGTLIAGLNLSDRILEKVLSKKGLKLEKKHEAVGNLQNAINATRTYLVKSNQTYAPNYKLSELWTNAFTSMIPFDKELAVMLRNKGKFWSDPKSWLQEPGAMELIPTLKELNDKCDEMMKTLQSRISKR